MRIVGGSLRGRRLRAPAGVRVRPTGERVREALFDILLHGGMARPLDGARVVDLFAGTGALGLEALSRGAASLTAVESEADVRGVLRANIEALGCADRATVVTSDAARLPPAAAACDLALLDPPYRSGLAAPALGALVEGGWLAAEATVVVEHGADEPFEPPAALAVQDRRRYGRTALTFLSPVPERT
ncbi:MAG: 16S rRNA (guanine(966)-N(2))-methyltransferase RsmD [Alphaproteobacteria bacterium]|nr:16S rRNA (guanine(966)-N(2))-methyltransferase RsmD [Alphaproteobacteria bacterium]